MNFLRPRFVSIVVFVAVASSLIGTIVVAWTPLVSTHQTIGKLDDHSGARLFQASRIWSRLDRSHSQTALCLSGPSDENLPLGKSDDAEEWSDFDDLGYTPIDSAADPNVSEKLILDPDDMVDASSALGADEMKGIDFAALLQEKQQATNKIDATATATSRSGPNVDYTAIQTRQFLLGQDLVISDYVGTMGFQEVTDWEYYYPDEDGEDRRQVVQPNPFDSNTPRRTRTSSGSIVRIFRGEFIGTVGGSLSAQGFDRRVLVKEFTDTDLALSLVRSELQSLGRLQSNLVFGKEMSSEDALRTGAEWIRSASARGSVDLRKDTANLVTLTKALTVAPFVGILGEVNLAELDGSMEPNEFYRALGVPPPKPGAVWLVYEYAGLATIQAYSEPAELRLARLPPKKGFFGNVIEATPPSWKDRANYVVKGIMKNTILAISSIHENGMVHGSIGRTSIILSSKEMDKRSAISPTNTMVSTLRVKLSEFAFARVFEESTSNEEFCTRARTFGLSFQKGDHNVLTTNFAIAEDMHAVGFVFLGLLLTTLAELPRPVPSTYQMPATDDDALQRLLTDIFDKDMNQFREFVLEEDIWSKLVELLDENDQSGWKVLETLVLARENAAKRKDTDQLFTIRGLLSTPFFQ